MISPAAEGAARGPHISLGNTTRPLDGVDSEGEFRASRNVRYALQRTAAGLLWDASAGKRQRHRVCHCCRSIRGDTVGVYRRDDGSRARFSGLMSCGSAWTCPVCGQIVAERRRDELSAGLVSWVQGGGRAHLLTFTFPHESDEPVADLLKRFDRARQRFQASRTWKGAKAAAESAGTVTSLEVTWGRNGWHPHLHMLLFVRRSLTDAEQSRLVDEWVRQLVNAGLGSTPQLADMLAHALDIRGGEDAADYITKYGREESWGLSSELTREHAKRAAADHLKPFGLLALAQQGEEWAGAKFREFAEAFFGKRLLTFSPGLRDALRLGAEVSDEALVEQTKPDESRVATLKPEQWRIVMERDARGELLDYVARSCVNPESAQADVDEWVAWVAVAKRRTSRGLFWFELHRGQGADVYAH